MEVRLRAKPSYTMAFCVMRHGEGIYVTRGGMVAMSDGIQVNTSVGSGGVGKAVLRKTLGGESFFTARYQAVIDQSWVAVAPMYPGDAEAIELQGETWLVEQGSFLAGSDTLNVDVKVAGARMALAKEGITMLKVHGVGVLLMSSYGGILPLDLGPTDEMTVDSGHIVALSETVTWKLGIVGGLVTTTTSGEGLVLRVTGPGRVYLQTRSEQGYRELFFPRDWENSPKGK